MAVMDDDDLAHYRQQIETWRQEREDALRSPDGWLSLVGLHMLDDGEYRLGSAASNQIVLPASVPEHWATLDFRSGHATLHVTSEPPVMVDGAALAPVVMVDNGGGRPPTVVRVGSVSLNLHRFGKEVALRVRDRASAAIREFGGCTWYEIDPAYCVVGKLQRQSPTAIYVATSVQTVVDYQSVGEICFDLLGQRLSLLGAATNKPSELMIIFKDATSGRESYGAGRYLYAPVDEDDNVVLDFNKAYSPPCAFTQYATCSLSPAENILAVPIAAGERHNAAISG